MNGENKESTKWEEVIGRSLAYLCMAQAEMREKDLATKGMFLQSLGLPRKDAAEMLGTSYASLTELIRVSEKRKGGKRAGKKKKN
jgi:hypothetical protein